MAQRSQAQVAFGQAVRAMREQRGISQEAFAHLAGMHRTYMSGIERGLKNPTYESMRKIADALHIRTSDLLNHAEELEGDGTDSAQN